MAGAESTGLSPGFWPFAAVCDEAADACIDRDDKPLWPVRMSGSISISHESPLGELAAAPRSVVD
ncbi:MAG: hypothetical protein ACREH9_10775, partial [Pseudomonadota bacterium]